MKVVLAAILVACLASPGQCGVRIVGNYILAPYRFVFIEFCGTVSPVTYNSSPGGMNGCIGVTNLPNGIFKVCDGPAGTPLTCTYKMCTTNDVCPGSFFSVDYPSGSTCDVDRDTVAFTHGSTSVSASDCCP